ncbi:MAG: hypothetical protein IMF06_00195 [Proteobacteria bacterium]|nr:hypothetical protein [Pseudomonadota bacterium]
MGGLIRRHEVEIEELSELLESLLVFQDRLRPWMAEAERRMDASFRVS